MDGGVYQTSNIFSNVIAGTHAVVVKDAKGCTLSKSITIVQPTVFNASASVGTISCNGGTTAVTVSATGGTAPYTGTGTFTVAAGTYNYIVSDVAGLKDTVSVIISQPAAITSSLSAGTIAVNGGTTSITVTAGGGTAPYTYNLNNGVFQSSNVFSGVLAGTFSINLKDIKGCIVNKSITITQPALITKPDPLIAAASAGVISCFGASSTVTVSATGGVQPYVGIGNYNVVAGSYSYIVSDASGQKDTAMITLSQPPAIKASVSANPITVTGGTTSITVAASGGTYPFQYVLDAGSFQTSNVFNAVSAGSHVVVTRDINGCSVNNNITISDYIPASSDKVQFRVKVYPNPSTTFFTLTIGQYHRSLNVYLMVYNVSNTLVYFGKGSSDTSFVFGSAFNPGTYYAKVTIGSTVKTTSLIKL